MGESIVKPARRNQEVQGTAGAVRRPGATAGAGQGRRRGARLPRRAHPGARVVLGETCSGV